MMLADGNATSSNLDESIIVTVDGDPEEVIVRKSSSSSSSSSSSFSGDPTSTPDDEDLDLDDHDDASDSDDWDPEKEVIGFLSGECRSPQDSEFHDKDYFSRLFASKGPNKDKWSTFHIILVFLVISVFTITMIGISALSVFMIYAYTQYHDQPCEKNLPVWLLVGGISTLSSVFLYLIDLMFCPLFTFGQRRPRQRAAVRFAATICFRCISNMLYAFETVWFVLGTSMVLRIPEAHECPAIIYGFSYYFILVNWCVVAVIFSLLCVYGSSIIVSTCLYGRNIAKDVEEEEEEVVKNTVVAQNHV